MYCVCLQPLRIFSLYVLYLRATVSFTYTEATRVLFDDVGWDELREVLILRTFFDDFHACGCVWLNSIIYD